MELEQIAYYESGQEAPTCATWVGVDYPLGHDVTLRIQVSRYLLTPV